MPHILEYFPWYAWLAMVGCGLVALVPFFLPPSVGTAVGLSLTQYIALTALVEFGAAIGIASLVIYYREPRDGADEYEDDEWRFDP